MSYLNNMDYRNCAVTGRVVCIHRAEGQCRSENRCEQAGCQLACEFSDRLLAPGTRLVAGAIGFGWLAGGARG